MNSKFSLLTVLLTVIGISDALECYECFDVAEVNVSIPGNPQLEESIKLAYQLMADPDCRLRDRVGATVERHTCDPFTEPDQANWRHVCSSGDIRTRMITNYDISGLKWRMTVESRNRVRTCAGVPPDTSTDYCDDVNNYNSLVNDILKDILKGIGGGDIGIDMEYKATGPVCSCGARMCNIRLPDDIPGSLDGAVKVQSFLIPLVISLYAAAYISL